MPEPQKPGEAKKRKLAKGRHRSTIKRHRQNLRHASRNRQVRRRLKAAVKKIYEAMRGKDKGAAEVALRSVNSLFDRAVSSGVLHHRNASRHIARLSTAVAHL